MSSESQRLEEEIHSIQDKLKTYPDGKFYCTRDGNHYKWYHSQGPKQTYIPKSNYHLAQQLAEKKYLSKKLDELIHEKRAIDFYLRHHSNDTSEQWFAEHPEHLIHKTISGNTVRSKSESLIDMALYTKGIPFRYECALQLGETILYPDFTIRHPITGNVYYWEHFGKMDNPKYAQNCMAKLQHYTMHGILPGINLTTTFETKNKPLTTEAIDRIILEFFF